MDGKSILQIGLGVALGLLIAGLASRAL